MADDFYPTPDDLITVENAGQMHDGVTWAGVHAAFAVLKGFWHWPEWGWHETPAEERGRTGTLYEISTGGWSGNESLMEAFERTFAWTLTWTEIRRGGHYRFFVPDV